MIDAPFFLERLQHADRESRPDAAPAHVDPAIDEY
jgi:hypothetical protein